MDELPHKKYLNDWVNEETISAWPMEDVSMNEAMIGRGKPRGMIISKPKDKELPKQATLWDILKLAYFDTKDLKEDMQRTIYERAKGIVEGVDVEVKPQTNKPGPLALMELLKNSSGLLTYKEESLQESINPLQHIESAAQYERELQETLCAAQSYFQFVSGVNYKEILQNAGIPEDMMKLLGYRLAKKLVSFGTLATGVTNADGVVVRKASFEEVYQPYNHLIEDVVSILKAKTGDSIKSPSQEKTLSFDIDAFPMYSNN
jgi:hypothetical protein